MDPVVDDTTDLRTHGGPTRRQDRSQARSLLIELTRTLTPPTSRGRASVAERRAVELFSNLLAAHGRVWPALRRPQRVTIDLTIRNDRFVIRVEPTDGFEPILEVRLSSDGELLAWKTWSAEPLLTYLG
jgi:hypothetical protein